MHPFFGLVWEGGEEIICTLAMDIFGFIIYLKLKENIFELQHFLYINFTHFSNALTEVPFLSYIPL